MEKENNEKPNLKLKKLRCAYCCRLTWHVKLLTETLIAYGYAVDDYVCLNCGRYRTLQKKIKD